MHECTVINSVVVMLCHKHWPIAITGHTIEFDTIYIFKYKELRSFAVWTIHEVLCNYKVSFCSQAQIIYTCMYFILLPLVIFCLCPLILILILQALFSLVAPFSFLASAKNLFCEHRLSSKWIDRGGNTSLEPCWCSLLTVIQLRRSLLPGDRKD